MRSLVIDFPKRSIRVLRMHVAELKSSASVFLFLRFCSSDCTHLGSDIWAASTSAVEYRDRLQYQRMNEVKWLMRCLQGGLGLSMVYFHFETKVWAFLLVFFKALSSWTIKLNCFWFPLVQRDKWMLAWNRKMTCWNR